MNLGLMKKKNKFQFVELFSNSLCYSWQREFLTFSYISNGGCIDYKDGNGNHIITPYIPFGWERLNLPMIPIVKTRGIV